MLSSIQIVSKEDADVERREISDSKKTRNKEKKKSKEKKKKKKSKERKKAKKNREGKNGDDDTDTEDSDEEQDRRGDQRGVDVVSESFHQATRRDENRIADGLFSSKEVKEKEEKEEGEGDKDKDGFFSQALLSSDVTKKTPKVRRKSSVNVRKSAFEKCVLRANWREKMCKMKQNQLVLAMVALVGD